MRKGLGSAAGRTTRHCSSAEPFPQPPQWQAAKPAFASRLALARSMGTAVLLRCHDATLPRQHRAGERGRSTHLVTTTCVTKSGCMKLCSYISAWIARSACQRSAMGRAHDTWHTAHGTRPSMRASATRAGRGWAAAKALEAYVWQRVQVELLVGQNCSLGRRVSNARRWQRWWRACVGAGAGRG